MLTHWSQLVPNNYVNRHPRTLSITGKKEGAHEQVRKQPRRDQEEGGELDSQEEASSEEIKSREVVQGYRERVGLLLLQLFPSGGATDICSA